jgi:glycosyltransferase involved in cell wall biosynthesis
LLKLSKSSGRLSALKILHFELGRHLYGGAQQVLYLLSRLPAEEFESTLVCPPDSAIESSCKDLGIRTIALKSIGDLDPTVPFKIRNLIKMEHPDLIHVHSRKSVDLWAGWFAKALGIPSVITRRVDNRESSWVVRRKYSLYHRTVAISEGIKQVLIEQGLDARAVTCVRSAIDTESFPRPIEAGAFRERFGIPDGSIVIGMVAQLIERKGHEILLNALEKLVPEFPNLQVLLFGKGPERSAIEKTISDKKLAQQVRLMGFADDMKSLYPHFDILVHPAWKEGLGVSLIEAAYCAVPIIASRAGGMPEIVRENENGLLIEPGNPKELENHMRTLLKAPDLRKQMGSKGKEIVAREFAVEPMVEGNIEIYRQLIRSTNPESLG